MWKDADQEFFKKFAHMEAEMRKTINEAAEQNN